MADKPKKTNQQHRRELRTLAAALAKAEDNKAIERNYEEQDPYEGLSIEGVMEPPYNFATLQTVVENSDILQSCINAMKQNIDGFGYELTYNGKDQTAKPPENDKDFIRGTDFFDRCNEERSFQAERQDFRLDFESVGCGAFEFIRDPETNNVIAAYALPVRNMRKMYKDEVPTTVTYRVKREGKDYLLRVRKRFRRYVLVYDNTQEYRYFKTLGDPRPLDAITGEYKKTPAQCQKVATEVLWLENKMPGYNYGIPRWFGALLDVLGRSDAQYVNRTLLSAGGTPKLIIMVTGGTLTDESWEDLKSVLQSTRGLTNYHEPLILEASADNLDLNASGGSTKLEILDWTKFREKDVMFEKYGNTTKDSVRNVFRLPPVYIGDLGSYTFASLYASRESGEEQVFIPEREAFDEVINNRVMPILPVTTYRYRTKGPQVRGSEETRKAIDTFSRAGALTINHSIRMANEAFRLNMSMFDEKWANYPIPIVMKMVEMGQLEGLDAIAKQIEEQPALPNEEEVVIPEEIAKSEAFTPDQKRVYTYLSGLMQLVGTREEDDSLQ